MIINLKIEKNSRYFLEDFAYLKDGNQQGMIRA